MPRGIDIFLKGEHLLQVKCLMYNTSILNYNSINFAMYKFFLFE